MAAFFSRLMIAAISCAASAVHAASLPACAPPVEASNVKVDRVEKNGVLVLSDGRAVHVEGLLLPSGAQDRAPAYLSDQAIGTLDDFARDRSVTLAVRPPKEDRYGRLRAQVFLSDGSDEHWLQIAMLSRGLARVSIAPDRRECAPALYAAEGAARKNGRGLWAERAYAVRRPQSLHDDAGTFQIVEGEIDSVDVKNGRAWLDFGPDWRTDFTATIDADDLKSFRAAGVDPLSYQGKSVRVRGWVELRRGAQAGSSRPEIEVAIPEDIEVLNAS